MKAYFQKKIPVNPRTVFFCLCASGACSFPVMVALRAVGYTGLDSESRLGLAVMLLAVVETMGLPAAAILFEITDSTLAALGVLLFLGVFFGAAAQPAITR